MYKKEKILLVHLTQYGKHTNSYKYCQYLKDYYHVSYLCLDQGSSKIEDETNVIYLKRSGSSIRDTFEIIRKARKLIAQEEYRVIYIFYFRLCSGIKLFQSNNFVLDIRTSSINKGWFEREKFNLILRLEAKLFTHLTVISDSLREKLKLNPHRSTIVPLGSDILSSKTKSYQNFHLLYIGTLTRRDIDKTVYGFSKFVQTHQDHEIEISYDIFGDGLEQDVLALKEAIIDSGMENFVSYHGRKEHHEITEYFDYCNVGVSYIPMQEYFDCQPPTKTFEYINSGMVCLATATSENKRLIHDDNGLLFEDNSEAFYHVLLELYKRRERYDTAVIIQSLTAYTWKNIVENRVRPLIASL